jgi:hypothetical protein
MTASGHIEAFPASTLNVGFEISNPTLIGHTAPTGLRRKRSFRQRDQAAISLNSMVSGVFVDLPAETETAQAVADRPDRQLTM